MDPLTHTLLGSTLASTRLRDATRLSTAALVIGANLPDVDSILYFTGHDDLALGFRRGWTHGVLALVVLPFVLTGLLLLYDRMRPDPQRPASGRWLLALSALAILTHPFLDWLNNYGMRWLMPFDGSWSYGDSVYIMDPWLWLILGIGWLAPRRPSIATILVLVIATLLLLRVVARRSESYVIVVIVVAAVLFLALLWRPRTPRIPAFALLAASIYIGARLIINQATEARVTREVARATGERVERVMASPHPMDPTRWDVVAQTGSAYRFGRFRWNHGLTLAPDRLPLPQPSPEWDAARRDPSVRGFMTWVRFPWYEVEHDGHETRVLIHDARYATRRRAGGGFGGVMVRLPRS
jgi:inner membrane protein